MTPNNFEEVDREWQKFIEIQAEEGFYDLFSDGKNFLHSQLLAEREMARKDVIGEIEKHFPRESRETRNHGGIVDWRMEFTKFGWEDIKKKLLSTLNIK